MKWEFLMGEAWIRLLQAILRWLRQLPQKARKIHAVTSAKRYDLATLGSLFSGNVTFLPLIAD
jgi:hypothetical protein